MYTHNLKITLLRYEQDNLLSRYALNLTPFILPYIQSVALNTIICTFI